MPVNLNKFVTNSLPEFLLLTLGPSDVFSMDMVVKSLHSVIVCYDVQYFYKNYQVIANRPADVVSLEEFISYCESKVQSKFIVKHIDYQCCMTVSDLIRMETWARLYDCVGPYLMKFLFFNCLLFVPLRKDIYYCVHTPSQQAGRYEVVQSFRTRAGSRWITKKIQNNQNHGNCSKTKQVCFNIAGLLKDIKRICQENADSMLREIIQTDGEGDETCFDVLKSKLKVIVNKDSFLTYKSIYKNTIGDSVLNEIPLSRVKKFTNAIVCKVVPRELFGVNGNRDQYCENLCKILNCGMFHDFTVQHIMHKIKVKKVKWLDRVDAKRRTEIMTKTLVWLTNVFVFGRIAYFFQIVTTNTPNNGIAYFAKNSWAKMCHEKISPLMSGGEFFKEIRPDTTRPSDSSTTYRNWKICPYAKPNGVRLIFKLRQKEVSSAHKQLMNNCLTFLRCLLRTYPAEFRSVSKSQFFHDWRALQESRDDLQLLPVYYVRTDFRDAFTSFEQGKLQAVVRDRIKEHFGKKLQTLNVHSVDMVKIGGGDSVYCKKRTYVDGLLAPNFPGGSLLFFDKTTTVPLSRIWDTIRRCIQCNAVERGGRRWAMTRGIVQGDRLSLALCDLLLADLQATHLNEMVMGPSNRLYRFVDDYVFVSTDQTAARRFLDAMCAGFDEYGLRLNLSKTETNLDGGGGGVGLIKFLGFRLNAVTGEVTKDESAYRNRRPLHFFDYDLGRGRSGRALYAKMTGPNQHTVPAILVSKSLNSAATVARNLASIVAYKAYTFVAAVKQYLFHLNPAFLLKTVHAVARLMYAKMCSLIQHSAITPMQCKWIVYEVYAKMFRRHFPKDNGRRITWTVDRIRDRQTAVGRKCNTRDLKTALRRYDFTKMFG